MGATGNLAQKYLWQSLRNIEAEGVKLVVWPAATRPNVQKNIDTILKENVTYPNGASDEKRFLSVVAPYHRLAESDDYVRLNKDIAERSKGKVEVGRLIYLSVPPKVFGAIAKEINASLRPSDKAWLKVIVEKPFGVDLNSALQLSRDLFSSLKNEEVLCVDHYMGKDGLSGIRDFHVMNPGYLSPSIIKRIEKVEIQMVETEDCKGRTSFYDEVGVIRDTMQNHLMMMLALFTMSEDKDEEFVRRTEVFTNLEALSDSAAIQALGQYSDYITHIKEDYETYYSQKMEKVPNSKTPTYARIALRFKSSSPYRSIPFVFTSGKALLKRRAFLRAIMKGGKDAITFNVQGDIEDVSGGPAIKDAAIHITSGLPEITCPRGWKQVSPRHCQGPKNAPNAYQVLLSAALHGSFDLFVMIPEVLQSWRVWTPLLDKDLSSFKLLKYRQGGSGLDDPLNGGREEREEL
jgi:hexose-6-phosphate dehydrogenase